MFIITKPILSSGVAEADSDTWHDIPDVVDMDLVAENFRRLFQGANGKLHASNLVTPPGSVSIDETLVRFPEFAGFHSNLAGLPGISHSHDGINSSRLGPGAIDQKVTRGRSFGAWMTPTKKRTLWHFWGIAPITISNIPAWDGSASDNETYVVRIEIPYNTHTLPRVWRIGLEGTSATYDSARVTTSLQNLNRLTRPYITIRNAKVSKVSAATGSDACMYLDVTLNVRNNEEALTSTDGLFVHWSIFALLEPLA